MESGDLSLLSESPHGRMSHEQGRGPPRFFETGVGTGNTRFVSRQAARIAFDRWFGANDNDNDNFINV